MRGHLILHILILISAGLYNRSVFAQEEPRFSPPRPVISDPADFDDPAEDDADFAGGAADFPRQVPPAGAMPGGAPALGGVPNSPSAPPVDFLPLNPGGGAVGSGGPGKLHFKVVQGLFWHKGMKRTIKHPPEEETSAPGSSNPNSQFAPPPPPPGQFDPSIGAPPADMGGAPPDSFAPDDSSQF